LIQQYTHTHPLALVCIAASEDAALLTQWEAHLRPLQQAGLVSVWSERHLAPGANRAQELQRHVDGADLVVVLLSADFFSSPECLAMRDRALERAHEGKTRVIPLLLRPVAWQESSLDILVPWPSNGKPITLWGDQDEGWHACVQELRHLLGRRMSEALRSKRPIKQTDPDWDRMLRRLRRSYRELLDQSLHSIAWVELGLTTRPDMVSNATNLLFRLPQGSEQLLPSGTRVLDAYDEAEGELLILGVPGAGKSTLLLDLAQQLVGRAQASEISLLPVILRLSSWAIGRPKLTNWMIEQLSRTYDVPQPLSERWVKEGRILPLLDGLDEVEETARPACIEAINSYHRTHLIPLVVCSRQTEYEVAAKGKHLALQSAVMVQPLSDEQIEEYLRTADPSFAGVRTALQQQPALWELATIPLMLSVLLLTYKGISANDIMKQETDLEQRVWTDYVARQVAEKGNDTQYPSEHTRDFLSWLAKQMREHQQATFYAEYLDIDWLAKTQQYMITQLATLLPSITIGVCISILVSVVIAANSFGPSLLQMGVLGGFVGGCLSPSVVEKYATHEKHPQNRKTLHIRNAVLLALLLAASFGLYSVDPRFYYGINDWIRDGWILGLGSLLSGWAFQRLLDHPSKQPIPIPRKFCALRGHRVTWMNTIAPPHVWQAAIALAIGIGIGLNEGLRTTLDDGEVLLVRLPIWLQTGLIDALSVIVTVILVYFLLNTSLKTLHFAERIHWTWRSLFHPGHFRIVGMVTAMTFIFFWLSDALPNLILALISGLNSSLIPKLISGLISGLVPGLISGPGIGLTYWLVLGLYQGMKQEHLEDQKRSQFNQGIRSSLRNGFLISLIGATIITSIGVLRVGLIPELSVAPIVLITAIIVVWAFSSGPTVLHHYVIRWALARHHTFPFHAQAFLDDATTRILLRRVGGGYSFIHRRLQDYFADTAVPLSEKLKSRVKG
jgi:TIR domain/NACHT domain